MTLDVDSCCNTGIHIDEGCPYVEFHNYTHYAQFHLEECQYVEYRGAEWTRIGCKSEIVNSLIQPTLCLSSATTLNIMTFSIMTLRMTIRQHNET
jgi:hypothetical protein